MVEELILIDDKSQDDSLKYIKSYKLRSKFKVKIISNRINYGLAHNYNLGINLTKTKLYILMHQDILLTDRRSITKIVTPFAVNPTVVGSYPSFRYTFENWSEDSFWQKVLFSRHIDKNISKMNGKFDCIKKDSRILFDSKRYHTAGEDFDFETRLSQIGKLEPTNLVVDHIQEQSNNFTIKKLIRKEAQLAECYGVNLARYNGQTSIFDKMILLSRIIVLFFIILSSFISLFVSISIAFVYSILYTLNVYKYCYKNKKIIALPLINLINLVIYNFYFARGFITRKQKI